MKMNCSGDRFSEGSGYSQSVQPLQVFLMGPGLIGGLLLDFLEKDERFQVKAVASSKYMWKSSDGLFRSDVKDEYASSLNWEEFIGQIPDSNAVFVDCSASDQRVDDYEMLLKRGVCVVTPNKKALTLDYLRFKRLTSSKKFFFEANVGAALPVISTLRTLLRSGDRIRRIEGVLSGTLSYLFNAFDGTKPFSVLVQQARTQGFTEPHPGEDLSGMDAARKILILARLCGLEMELGDMRVENLVPADCRNIDEVDSFLHILSVGDASFEKRRLAAGQGRLRYLATFDGTTCEAGLKTVEPDHPAFGLSGTDNLVLFHTDRYCETPLVIRGPGAGQALTTGQVYCEMVQVYEAMHHGK
jgi:aspartokinase/homoserine dehydrogenase 1